MKTQKSQNYVKKRRISTILCFVIIGLYSAIFFLTKDRFESLRYLRLLFLFPLAGISFTFFFRKLLPYQNLFTLFVYSSVYSILFIPLIFLILGYVLSFFNVFLIFSILGILSLLGLFCLHYSVTDEEIAKYRRLTIRDYINLFLLSFFFLLLFKLSLEFCNPAWDSFTFWAVDAKYIFEKGRFRDSSFDVLSTFRYTSYLPTLYASVYFAYGRIVEVFASSINVFIGLVSSLFVYSLFLNKRNYIKTMITILLMLAGLYFLKYYYLYVSLYSEIICAFFILIFSVVLVLEYGEDTYWKRILLILFIILSLYLTKLHYWPIAITAIFLLISYDFIKFHANKNSLKKYVNLKLVVSFFIPLLLLFLFLYFLKDIHWITGVFTGKRIGTLEQYFEYIWTLLQYLGTIIILPILFLTSFISILFIKRGNVKPLVLFFVGIILIIPPVFLYIIERSEAFASLNRYLSISIYIPILVFGMSFVDIKKNNKKDGFKIVLKEALVVLFLLFTTLSILKEYKFSFKISPLEGSYSSCLYSWYVISQDTLEIIGNLNNNILILNEEFGNIGNMNVPDIYIRYYLSNQSVGGQYRVPKDKIYDEIEKIDPDYLLVLEYDNYFEECNFLLEEGSSYLIKYQQKGSVCEDIIRVWE